MRHFHSVNWLLQYANTRDTSPRLTRGDSWSWFDDEGEIKSLKLLGKSLNPGEFNFYYGADGIDNIRINVIEKWKRGQLFWHGPHTLETGTDLILSHRGCMSREDDFEQPVTRSSQERLAPSHYSYSVRLMDQRSSIPRDCD